MFSTPCSDVLYSLCGEIHHSIIVLCADSLILREDSITLCIDQNIAYSTIASTFHTCCKAEITIERTITLLVNTSCYVVIGDILCWSRVEVNVLLNTTDAPIVLTLEV